MQLATSKGLFCFFCTYIWVGSCGQGFWEGKSFKETSQEMGVSLRFDSG